ncbi:MAG: sugar transferase [Dehalococcoidia bacterium]
MQPSKEAVRTTPAEDDHLESGSFSDDAVVIPWRYPARPVGFYRRGGKRWLDLLMGASLVVVLLPVMALVAAAVFVSSGRPVLFCSQRVGRNGAPINVWKFRTMVRDADRVLQQWQVMRPDLAAAYQDKRKLSNDPRVTLLGRFLRKSSLDELPQLWNVMRGDMSLVGPRPVPQHELEEKYGPLSEQAFAATPGLTGLWQVSGRSATGYADRVRLDCEYAAGGDLMLDLRIIALTVPAILLGRGAE